MTWVIPDVIKEISRKLRKNMTESEKIIWDKIKNKKNSYRNLFTWSRKRKIIKK